MGDLMPKTKLLTDTELSLITDLGRCHDKFCKIIEKEGLEHPSDREDFTKNIHMLQRHVMARVARRAHPELFIASQDI